ncbi:MAG: PASTA domain-containing protein [Hoylesella shahii]|uniref:PASTA domain-containing protein n=1 Tax=Hoylesella shahii TaxID=228603 RepID=UPI003FA0A816
MKSSDFFGKLTSKYIWLNLLAMAIVLVLLVVGAKFGIDIYTHHGEAILIPDIRHKSYADAKQILANEGLLIEVTDTGYVRTLPADCILEQSPQPGDQVKSGHVIYVIVNSGNTPTITLPDIIDNSSVREAIAKLTAMGFKVGPPQYIVGEREWVYGATVNGRHVSAGERIPVGAVVVLQVGNGSRSADDSSIDYVEPIYNNQQEAGGESEVDEFDVVSPSELPQRNEN